jgi:Methylase involved in ubiquinone/menaquinone biosynthesis
LGLALRAVFPRLESVIIERSGKTVWDALTKHYFEIYPARHFELNMNGAHFPEYLEQHATRFGLPSWVAELADFEWWEWQTLTAPDAPADAMPQEGLLRLGATVELRPYTHDLIDWFAAPDTKSSPAERDAVTIFWRDANADAWRRNVDDLDLELLRLVEQKEVITPLTLSDLDESWDTIEGRIAEMIQDGILLGQLPATNLSDSATVNLSAEELEIVTRSTTDGYGLSARDFFEASLEHDVSQNHQAFLESIEGHPPFNLLDLGCGAGRDLKYFRLQGHHAVGLEGARELAEMAQEYSGCEVLHSDFLNMSLPVSAYDGIFANASLFHVPSQELPRILRQLWSALKPHGVLFASNPKGENQEGWVQGSYAVFYALETWSRYLESAGFERLSYYYRPDGLPEAQQKWLATVWRRRSHKGINEQPS